MSALRIAHPGSPARLIEDRDPEADLSVYQRRVLLVLRSYNGNKSRAARELGTTTASVQQTARLLRRRGVTLPPMARRGPDLRQRPSRRREARV